MRARMRALRKRLARETPDAGVRLAAFAGGLPDGVAHALYLPMGAEMDVGPLASQLARAGHDLCLPVVTALNAPLSFREWTPGEALTPDLAGIAAPLGAAREMTPDVILTPLLAFDAFGGRLGQGGGYYDRTFAALPDAIRIGVAYAGQRIERVPVEPHDIPLHGVLTETGYTPARKG